MGSASGFCCSSLSLSSSTSKPSKAAKGRRNWVREERREKVGKWALSLRGLGGLICGGKWLGTGVGEWGIEKLEILLQSEEEQEVLVEAMDREEASIVRGNGGIEKLAFGWRRSSSRRQGRGFAFD